MTSARVSTSPATLAGGLISPAAPWASAGRAVEMLLTWCERARQRQQLGQLSDHMLKDIGLSRLDVETEVAKPFWRP